MNTEEIHHDLDYFEVIFFLFKLLDFHFRSERCNLINKNLILAQIQKQARKLEGTYISTCNLFT